MAQFYGDWIYDEEYEHWRSGLSYGIKTETDTQATVWIRAELDAGYYYLNSSVEGEDKTLLGRVIYKIGDQEQIVREVHIPFPFIEGVGNKVFDNFDLSVDKTTEEQNIIISVIIQGIKYEDFYWDRDLNQPEKSTITRTITIPSLPTYTISYDTNGGIWKNEPPANQTKIYDQSLTLTSIKPTRTGYDFMGWNTQSDGTGISYRASGDYTENADAILYAQWQIMKYIVLYDGNGGMGAPNSQLKIYDQPLTLSSIQPTRPDGYNFIGWNTKSNGTGTNYEAGGDYTENASTTLYAQWQRIYIITYDTNGGTPSSIPSQQKPHGESVILSRTRPTKTGYIFEGWATSANSTVVKYAPGSNYSNNADLNLYAVWTIITFTITFNPNGGSWSGPETQTKEYGTTLTLTSVEPTRTGYSFVRWGTNSDGSGVQYQSGGSYIRDEDAILYALWRTTINYNANGGTGEMAPSNTFSSVNLRWNSFTRIGYKFIGWNTKADGTGISYDDGATYSGENVTLYAQWKEIPWIDSITYQKEEDGVSQQIKFFIGTTFDRVYDTVARGFSLQDLAIALKRFFKKQAFMIYAGNKPADYSKVMEWYAISGDTSDLEVDPALIVIDSDV